MAIDDIQALKTTYLSFLCPISTPLVWLYGTKELAEDPMLHAQVDEAQCIFLVGSMGVIKMSSGSNDPFLWFATCVLYLLLLCVVSCWDTAGVVYCRHWSSDDRFEMHLLVSYACTR